jgi:hypothetical protein
MFTMGANAQQMDQLKQREEFLQSLSNFRPKETVFEAFATGGGKDVGVLSHIDKGRTTHAAKKNDSSLALSAMKGMRRQMKMVTDKSAKLIVAGSQEAPLTKAIDPIEDALGQSDNADFGCNQLSLEVETWNAGNDEYSVLEQGSKRRISKAVTRRTNPGKRT